MVNHTNQNLIACVPHCLGLLCLYYTLLSNGLCFVPWQCVPQGTSEQRPSLVGSVIAQLVILRAETRSTSGLYQIDTTSSIFACVPKDSF